jgi:hypothetical protein
MIRTPLLKRAMYTVPVIGALLFGTSQVFAAPARQAQEAVCHEDLCQQWCGGPAFCEPTGACICI